MDPDPILAMPFSSCVCFHNFLMRPSFQLDCRCSKSSLWSDPHRDVTRLFKSNKLATKAKVFVFSMLRLSWWPTSNASNANSRRVQVGWATSGCERSNRSLAKLLIEISWPGKEWKEGRKEIFWEVSLFWSNLPVPPLKSGCCDQCSCYGTNLW